MTAKEKIKNIQRILGVGVDGIPLDETQGAWKALVAEALAPASTAVVSGYASSFADPADVAAFKRCKATGKTDMHCFAVGDNGIGVWGDDTTVDIPYCALPREDWEKMGASARGKRVRVTANNRTVICELRDTMPRKKNIKNGCVVDLNPAAVKALGLKPPIKVKATWQWV